MKKLLAIFCLGLGVLGANDIVQAQTLGNTAKVVFYRPGNDGGRAYALTSQNKALAKLKKGEKFEQQLQAPGIYYYMADPATKQVFKLEVKAGQTYYVRSGKVKGYFDGQPSLQISTEQEYRQAVSNAE